MDLGHRGELDRECRALIHVTDRVRVALLLAPALVILGGLFLGGLGVAALRSFGYMPILGLTEPNLDAYRTILTDTALWQSLGRSLYIAGTSTRISAVLAVAAALLIRSIGPGRRALTFLFQLNLTMPHLVGAIGVLLLLSQSGSFARLAFAAGLIERPGEFPALVYDRASIGIIVQYIWKELPFIGVIVLANMRGLGTAYENAARSLGASRWQAVRHVLLPMILPGTAAASAIVFAFVFGAYEIPALLGTHFPQALPVLAYDTFTDPDLTRRPEAMAMAMLITAVSALLIWAYMRLLRGGAR